MLPCRSLHKLNDVPKKSCKWYLRLGLKMFGAIALINRREGVSDRSCFCTADSHRIEKDYLQGFLFSMTRGRQRSSVVLRLKMWAWKVVACGVFVSLSEEVKVWVFRSVYFSSPDRTFSLSFWGIEGNLCVGGNSTCLEEGGKQMVTSSRWLWIPEQRCSSFLLCPQSAQAYLEITSLAKQPPTSS